MSATIGFGTEHRPFYLAMILGLACAFVIGKALPSTMDAISAIIEPLCASSDPAGSTLDTVEPISSQCWSQYLPCSLDEKSISLAVRQDARSSKLSAVLAREVSGSDCAAGPRPTGRGDQALVVW